MTEGKPKKAYSFEAIRAKTILVGGKQFLKLRLLRLYGLTPAAVPSTGELITAALASNKSSMNRGDSLKGILSPFP